MRGNNDYLQTGKFYQLIFKNKKKMMKSPVNKVVSLDRKNTGLLCP